MTQQDKVNYLKRFAKQLGCEYKESSIGFDRDCVSISKGTNSLGYNLEAMYGTGTSSDERLQPPDGVEAYHKGNYMAVLITKDNTKEMAIDQLFNWVRNIDIYELEVYSFYSPIPTVGSLLGNPFEPAVRIVE